MCTMGECRDNPVSVQQKAVHDERRHALCAPCEAPNKSTNDAELPYVGMYTGCDRKLNGEQFGGRESMSSIKAEERLDNNGPSRSNECTGTNARDCLPTPLHLHDAFCGHDCDE
jgi:hypothetical protein